ncbi:hypothetical protein R1sor_021682 [Riccia sorocarpa]|uniref:Uncharacterized protein n=1 Tax=Riccia sorocarpa TaxID=122646 RepID=A0ABD3GJ68_9MARC
MVSPNVSEGRGAKVYQGVKPTQGVPTGNQIKPGQTANIRPVGSQHSGETSGHSPPPNQMNYKTAVTPTKADNEVQSEKTKGNGISPEDDTLYNAASVDHCMDATNQQLPGIPKDEDEELDGDNEEATDQESSYIDRHGYRCWMKI